MRKLILGLGLTFGLVVSIGALTAGAVTSNKAVGVTLNEFNVLTATQGAPPGTVTFTVKNTGKLEHEFVVVRTARPAGSLLKGAEASEVGAVGEIGSVKPGQSKKLALKLRVGHYSLLCNIEGSAASAAGWPAAPRRLAPTTAVHWRHAKVRNLGNFHVIEPRGMGTHGRQGLRGRRVRTSR